MTKTILLTGATDGIGFETAKLLAREGHTLLLHGRNVQKLATAREAISAVPGAGAIETFSADLADLAQVEGLAREIAAAHTGLDVLINNAGVLKSGQPITKDGRDIRFVVNTLAPYVLTKRLLPLLSSQARVINVSSAAQAPVDLQALTSGSPMDDMAAYGLSKLAITMWTRALAREHKDGPIFVAVNPGSLLASKMVKEGFGVAGSDLSIGADILVRAALASEFAGANGKYFDNDSGRFANPHPDAMDDKKCVQLTQQLDALVS